MKIWAHVKLWPQVETTPNLCGFVTKSVTQTLCLYFIWTYQANWVVTLCSHPVLCFLWRPWEGTSCLWLTKTGFLCISCLCKTRNLFNPAPVVHTLSMLTWFDSSSAQNGLIEHHLLQSDIIIGAVQKLFENIYSTFVVLQIKQETLDNSVIWRSQTQAKKINLTHCLRFIVTLSHSLINMEIATVCHSTKVKWIALNDGFSLTCVHSNDKTWQQIMNNHKIFV